MSLATANGKLIIQTSTLKKLTMMMTTKQNPRRRLPTIAPIGSRRTSLGFSFPVERSFRGMCFLSRNWNAKTRKHAKLHAKKGKIVYALKAALLIENPSQTTTLVGFPTNSTILAVLAAANSEMSQGMGSSWFALV